MDIDFVDRAPQPLAPMLVEAAVGSGAARNTTTTASSDAAPAGPQVAAPPTEQPSLEQEEEEPAPMDSEQQQQQQQHDDDDDDDDDSGQLPPAAGPYVSAHLARLLASVSGAGAHQQQKQLPVSGHQLLMLVTHAAMLETGFTPVAAVTEAAEAAPPAAGHTYDAAEILSSSKGAGVCTLAYCFGAALDSGSSSSSSSIADRTACTAASSVVVRCMEVGQHLVVAGMVAGSSSSSSSAGGGHGLQSLTLSVPQYCSGGGDSGSSSPSTAPIASSSSAAQPQQQQKDQEQQQQLVGRLSATLPALWIVLRDRLALPLLAAACAAAGLAPPVGLLTMPWELQEAWLKLLPVRGCGCGCGCVGGSV